MLLRLFGRWSMIRRREVREVIKARSARHAKEPDRQRRLVRSTLGLLAVALLVGAALAQTPGRWSKAAAMPEERTEVTVAALGDRIYVVGGFGGRGGLLEYDPATDTRRSPTTRPAISGAR